MKSKDVQLRLLYPARFSFKVECKIRSFPDKIRLKEYASIKPALQKMLKGLLEEGEEKGGGGTDKKGKNGNV